jgi:AICAR transformylase/IMP cyclohydrolase PurH
MRFAYWVHTHHRHAVVISLNTSTLLYQVAAQATTTIGYHLIISAGENPHQAAAFYTDDSLREFNAGGVATSQVHWGKEMSYNNYLVRNRNTGWFMACLSHSTVQQHAHMAIWGMACMAHLLCSVQRCDPPACLSYAYG